MSSDKPKESDINDEQARVADAFMKWCSLYPWWTIQATALIG